MNEWREAMRLPNEPDMPSKVVVTVNRQGQRSLNRKSITLEQLEPALNSLATSTALIVINADVEREPVQREPVQREPGCTAWAQSRLRGCPRSMAEALYFLEICWIYRTQGLVCLVLACLSKISAKPGTAADISLFTDLRSLL